MVGGGTPNDVGAGTTSVGAAISRLLGWEGCRVAVLGQRAEPSAVTANLIKEDGGEAISIQGDASLEVDCRDAVRAVVSEFGALDILINNLGLIMSGTAVTELTEVEWDRIMAVNAKGPMLMAKHCVPLMRNGGSVINISSIAATRHRVGSSIPYAASKAAVNALTIALAIDVAHLGIRVNCISVGSVWTPRVVRRLANEHPMDIDGFREGRRLTSPLQTEGTGWDVAYAAAFLASDEARWITGQTLVVDGGATLAWPPEKHV